jgi:cupin fold WbuC family metalloprotein
MKIVKAEAIAALLERAATAPRKRMNLNLHVKLSDPVCRLLNAGLAGSYVRPHRHRIGKWELVNVLQGRLDVVIFNQEGEIKNRLALGSGSASVVEIPGGEWHTVVFCAPAAVALEVKPGPYEPQLDKEFAEWAPEEGAPRSASFMAWLESALPGERWRRTEAAIPAP